MAKTGGLICKLCCLNVKQRPRTDLIPVSSLVSSPCHSGAGKNRLEVEDGVQQLLWLPGKKEKHHNTCWKSSSGTKSLVFCSSGDAWMESEMFKVPVSIHSFSIQQARNSKRNFGPIMHVTLSKLAPRARLR